MDFTDKLFAEAEQRIDQIDDNQFKEVIKVSPLYIQTRENAKDFLREDYVWVAELLVALGFTQAEADVYDDDLEKEITCMVDLDTLKPI